MTLTVTQSPSARRILVTWAGETTAAAASVKPYEPEFAMSRASVQFAGTFGGDTVILAGSNDGVTYTALKDRYGTSVSVTAAGQFDLATAYRYYKPVPSVGTGDSINVYLVHWAAE